MISLNQFIIKKVSEKDNVGLFEIGPLPTGYGHTLGNFIRRVLLSSIPGSAITSVKIDGVQHEYSTLAGLPDDILTLVLSIKNVVLVNKTLEPQTVEINVKGKDGAVVEVKAGDITGNSNVEVVNKDYVITSLTSSKAKFKAEIVVERGVGYKMGSDQTRKEAGNLPVDSNFSPVKLVNYDISPTRVGKETELDQLNLSIQTNGALSPVESLNIAVDILNQMTSHLVDLSAKMLNGDEIAVTLSKQQKVEDSKVAATSSTHKQELKVADMNLSTRLTNALLRSGYTDMRKMEGMTEDEVANIRGMGSKSLIELLDTLKKHSVKLI